MAGNVAECANCSQPFKKWREDHRFCCRACKDEFHNRERLAAVKAWREQLAQEARAS